MKARGAVGANVLILASEQAISATLTLRHSLGRQSAGRGTIGSPATSCCTKVATLSPLLRQFRSTSTARIQSRPTARLIRPETRTLSLCPCASRAQRPSGATLPRKASAWKPELRGSLGQEIAPPLLHDAPIHAAAAAYLYDHRVEALQCGALPRRVEQRERGPASRLDEHAVVV